MAEALLRHHGGDRLRVFSAGTEPAAVFRSTDNGETFELERALWDHPHRPQWNAGFGGQAFMAEVMPKVEEAVRLREERGLPFHIEVDGGVDPQTARIAAGAGANVFVAGSSTFKAPDIRAAISAIREA